MRFEEKRVRIDRIDPSDETYRITTESEIDRLIDSIQAVGLINFPILIRKDQGFTIISGFRRIASCGALGWTHIDGRIVDPQTPLRETANMAISENVFQRTLNLIEQSRVVLLLSTFYNSDHILAKKAAHFGLPNSPSFTKKIKQICLLPEPIQSGVLSNAISFAMALELGILVKEIGVIFANLFVRLKLSLNKQREIVMHAKEISQREDISVLKVLEEGDIEKILNSEDLDQREQAQRIRSYLERRRFPTVVARKKKVEIFVKNLKLEKNTKLIPSKYFEDPTFTLKLHFKDSEGLKRHRATLEKVIQNFNI
ncbi:MAG: ParB/RepB/Spo0J family partition protein [Desulfobacterales bacterium]|nr:ParB/RepB/Spo0J family partition protein [Desulfobacterales bacterium]